MGLFTCLQRYLSFPLLRFCFVLIYSVCVLFWFPLPFLEKADSRPTCCLWDRILYFHREPSPRNAVRSWGLALWKCRQFKRKSSKLKQTYIVSKHFSTACISSSVGNHSSFDSYNSNTNKTVNGGSASPNMTVKNDLNHHNDWDLIRNAWNDCISFHVTYRVYFPL